MSARTSKSRLLAASATLGVVAVMGGVPAAFADDADGATPAGSAVDAPVEESTATPSAEQTSTPPEEPTPTASAEPTVKSSAEPTDQPSAEPTDATSRPSGAPSDGPSTGSATPVQGLAARAVVTTTSTASPEPEPIFGFRKIRVGVQLKDGSYVPSGSSTAGTKLTFTSGDREPVDCTTGPVEADGSSFCEQPFVAFPGDTSTVTQTTVNDGLVIVTGSASIGPCEQDPGGIILLARAGRALVEDSDSCAADLTTLDAGTPPTATDDTAAGTDADPGGPIDVNVFANDDDGNGAPIESYSVSTPPSDEEGTASFLAGGGGSGMAAFTGPVVRFTPRTGFSGTATFGYTFATKNGSASARVTVTVPAQQTSPAAPTTPTTPTTDPTGTPTADPTTPPVTDGSDGTTGDSGATEGVTSARVAPSAATESTGDGALPGTGGPDGRLLGLGAALVGVGGVVTLLGRRRRTPQQ